MLSFVVIWKRMYWEFVKRNRIFCLLPNYKKLIKKIFYLFTQPVCSSVGDILADLLEIKGEKNNKIFRSSLPLSTMQNIFAERINKKVAVIDNGTG